MFTHKLPLHQAVRSKRAIKVAGQMLNDSLSGYAVHRKAFCFQCNKIRIDDKRLKAGKTSCEACRAKELMDDRGDDSGKYEQRHGDQS